MLIMLGLAIGIACSLCWIAAFAIFTFTSYYIYEPNPIISSIEMAISFIFMLVGTIAFIKYVKAEKKKRVKANEKTL